MRKGAFEIVAPQEPQIIEDKLNNRPRKTLGFKTPSEVFLQASRFVVESAHGENTGIPFHKLKLKLISHKARR